MTTDGPVAHYDVTSTADPDQTRLSPATPRRDGEAATPRREGETAGGNWTSGVVLYIGAAASCVVVVIAVTVAVVMLYRRQKSKRDHTDGMLKCYVVPDPDFVYTRNDTPDPVDNARRRRGHRTRSPYESTNIDELKVDDVSSSGQPSAATSTAILDGDQRGAKSAAPVDNTCPDTADLYAVPRKKKKPAEGQTPEAHIYDNNVTIEHKEDYLCRRDACDNEEFVDDEMFVVDNDLSDQISVVL